jgi:UDP-N-acetylmuramoyl-tripeptide--D-alanyl-D-alanine ligase
MRIAKHHFQKGEFSIITRSLKEIQDMVHGSGLNPTYHSHPMSGVSIDTRTIAAGNVYIPIIRLDNGHRYVQEAIDKGAAASLWQSDQPNPPAGIPLIRVPDTLKALQDLSKAYRDQLNVKVIGITGSNGKTTTKDILHAILSTTYKTQKTQGNYNGEYGLPLTLLELEQDTQIAIVEMGMSHSGEIKLLSEIARPDVAIITMIGVSHISSLGSKEAIAIAKLEITAGLHPEGTLIFNGDEPLLHAGLSDLTLPKTVRRIRFGEAADHDYYPIEHSVSEDGIHFTTNHEHAYVLPMLGKHNIVNALASIAAANEFNISSPNIHSGLQNLKVTEMRMQQIRTHLGYTIINDAWNASPASMQAAIQTAAELSGYTRKILVLGDMLELGAHELEYHKEIALFIHYGEVDFVFTVGHLSAQISDQLYGKFPLHHVKHFSNKQECTEQIQRIVEENDVVLVKGSRGMRLEEVVQQLNKGGNE